MDAFQVCDDVLRQGIQGISDLISQPSLINLDFADVEAIMRNKGMAHMGIGVANGEDRAMEAARQAVASPLLETSINGAKSVLINITGDSSLGLMEIEEAASLISQAADPDANIIFGAGIDDSLESQARITVIATGFAKTQQANRSRQLSPRGGAPAGGRPNAGVEQPYAPQTFGSNANRNAAGLFGGPEQNSNEVRQREVAPPYGGSYQNTTNVPNDPYQTDDDDDDLDVPPFLRRRR